MPTVRGVQGRDLRRRVRVPVRNVFALRYIPRDDPVIIMNVVVVAVVSDGYSSSIATSIPEFVRRLGSVHHCYISFSYRLDTPLHVKSLL